MLKCTILAHINSPYDYFSNFRDLLSCILQISFLVHEAKNVVYLEFYVTVGSNRQSSAVVAPFYQSNNVTIGALSALLNITVSESCFID